MSLNWKEINLILEELDIEGAQIQGVVQSAFDIIILKLHKKGVSRNLLISISSGACRIHETFKPFPKSDKPLRFAQFLNSRIVNGYIHKAEQLGDNRIVYLKIKRGDFVYNLYIRLWSNAANFIVTDEEGIILDAMRRLPKRAEVTGKKYEEICPQITRINTNKKREYDIRVFTSLVPFNKHIDDFYAEQGGSLSLEQLREQARRIYEAALNRISAALDRLREKAALFEEADKLKSYGDLILSNIASINPGDKYLETEENGKKIKIELEPDISPGKAAAIYYDQYRKAKTGHEAINKEIEAGENELKELSCKLENLLKEENPLVLAKLISKTNKSTSADKPALKNKKGALKKERPGLTFVRGDWQIIVGRNAAENDTLLRRHVNGNDLWLHARDYHGSYVFIKQRKGKTVPLEVLLDAGNLAVFYSKGRNNAGGDLFYTQVKYLRRAKDGPKGLVIPTQEKNLHIKLDENRLQELEKCRI